jgi:hypothetical protein
MEKVYQVLKRHKATGTMKNGKRVVRCDVCGRMVAVNGHDEVVTHGFTSVSAEKCPMSWKKIKCSEDHRQ